MKILVIGGTRFLGKQVVDLLLSEKHVEMTVLSRTDFKNFKGKKIIISEKEDGLKILKGTYFDIVIDFIAYELDSVKLVFTLLEFQKYILISTCWLNKLNESYKMNEIIENVDTEIINTLPIVTKKYLIGKSEIEKYLVNKINQNFFIVRLPILLGEGDHTKRLNFYVDRVRDGKGVLLVNDGQSQCQFVDVKLVARVLANFILTCLLRKGFLFEMLPNYSFSTKQLVSKISANFSSPSKMFSISSDHLKDSFPEYLDEEPFWHEVFFPTTDNNLFKISDINVYDSFDEWLKMEVKRISLEGYARNSKIRNSEIDFIKRYF
jgi:nucleoside-diphosphate-sugar epimerase